MQPFILITKNVKGRSIDPFCWRCHKIRTHINCSICPKAFHLRCLPTKLPDISEWTCIECADMMNRYFFIIQHSTIMYTKFKCIKTTKTQKCTMYPKIYSFN